MDIAISNALSGLVAARQRIAVAASNIANAGSDGALPGQSAEPNAPQAYVPLRVDQQSLEAGGTLATTRSVDPSFVTAYDPNAPYANAAGEVAAPNVDLATEAIDTLAAARAYEANLRVVETATEIDREAVDLGRHDLTA
ncbi:MAG TPA: flagellar basal body rod C-terminal domain-containing protein [Stellaceae bacterium]|nr:flagellar basal body rod C-terminal domain-containing protein [Stellaceae bacterium]